MRKLLIALLIMLMAGCATMGTPPPDDDPFADGGDSNAVVAIPPLPNFGPDDIVERHDYHMSCDDGKTIEGVQIHFKAIRPDGGETPYISMTTHDGILFLIRFTDDGENRIDAWVDYNSDRIPEEYWATPEDFPASGTVCTRINEIREKR